MKKPSFAYTRPSLSLAVSLAWAMFLGAPCTNRAVYPTIKIPIFAFPSPSLPPSYSVTSAPYLITTPPASLSVYEGLTLRLEATATGNPPPAYQWQLDGTDIPGATASAYTIARAQQSDAGSYAVVASNQYGRATSKAATVSIVETSLPVVLQQPASAVLNVGETARFVITVDGAPAPTYQWRKDGVSISGATAATLVVPNLRSTDAGRYDAAVTNLRGSVTTAAATLDVQPLSPLSITRHPTHANVAPGAAVTFTVAATGTNLSYQWRKNGGVIAGATITTHAIPTAVSSDMGFYSVVVTGNAGSIESEVAVLTVSSASSSRLVNLSTRGYVPAGGALTPGFTWRGSGPKPVVVRAVGPTLAQFGLTGTLADPTLEVIPAGATAPVRTNDNWNTEGAGLSAATAAVGAFPLDPGSKDAAVLLTLAGTTRNHTVRVTATDPKASGVVLTEIYDADSAISASRLTAVSVLGFAGTDNLTLVPGFTITGSAPKRVLVRAIGPGLESFGVADLLTDPQLAVHASGLEAPVARNDDWNGATELVAAFFDAGAFPLAPGSRDAALVVALPPGSFTVAVFGKNRTGNVLVEVYDLDP